MGQFLNVLKKYEIKKTGRGKMRLIKYNYKFQFFTLVVMSLPRCFLFGFQSTSSKEISPVPVANTQDQYEIKVRMGSPF